MTKEIIGFDIGHGESAVTRMPLIASGKPETLDLDGEKWQITAVGDLPDGGVVIGEQVFRDPRTTNVRLGFKERPPGTDRGTKALCQFVGAVHRMLVSTKQILGGDQSCYFVGCPSGWTQDELDQYQKLLAMELPIVEVVRESRAALLQARETGRITPELIKGTILVIDVGSSTTDVSLIVGGIREKGIDFGRQLGAHLIDKAILDYAVLGSRHRTAIMTLFASNPDARAHCERSCRRAKEEYWKANEAAQKQGVRVLIPLEPTDLVLDFRLNQESMDSILSLPVAEIGGSSWVGCFESFLQEVRELLARRRATPGILVLSGGPSRMLFIRRMCEQHFPEPTTTHVWCTPPEETVAQGLARWGSISCQTSAFIDEVEVVCSSTVPAAVRAQAVRIKTRLADEVSAAIATGVLKPLLGQWRSGIWSTLDSMQAQLKAQVEAWPTSAAGRAAIQRSYAEPLDAIFSTVNSSTLDICKKYGIPHASLRLEFDQGISSEHLGVPVGSPFDTLTGVATGITFTVLLVLTGIAKGTLLTVSVATGPPGWLVGALVAAWAALFGTMALSEALGGWDLPLTMRRTFLSESRCEKIVSDAQGKLRESLLAGISDSDLKKVESSISEQVSVQLRTRAEELRWIIS